MYVGDASSEVLDGLLSSRVSDCQNRPVAPFPHTASERSKVRVGRGSPAQLAEGIFPTSFGPLTLGPTASFLGQAQGWRMPAGQRVGQMRSPAGRASLADKPGQHAASVARP